ncbi:MAG: hypothetical protein HWN66_20255 [Candidatus Helarchaeota archaeon]|nr:hypothetical protein [Candidatus Helarchaeota archaeon]
MGFFFTNVNWVAGFILFMAFTILLFYFSVILYRHARESSVEEGRNIYLYAIMLFFFFLGIAYAIRTYFMFILPETIKSFTDNLTLTTRVEEIIQKFWQIHMFFAFLGVGILMIGVEKELLNGRTKYVIAAATLIFNIFIIALPYKDIHPIHFPLLLTPLIVVFAYLYVGITGVGEVRKNAYAIVCGFIIFFAGIILNSTTVREIFGAAWHISITTIIAPISLIVGFIILARGFQNKF